MSIPKSFADSKYNSSEAAASVYAMVSHIIEPSSISSALMNFPLDDCTSKNFCSSLVCVVAETSEA